MTEDQLPMKSEHAAEDEEERSWRDVAQRWKQVGQQVRNLGERLGGAFREGWETDEVAEEETKRLAERLRELGERMDRAVDSVRDEARAPGTRAKAKETMYTTRQASTELLSELQETLNEGLAEVNKRMDDMIRRRREKRPSDSL